MFVIHLIVVAAVVAWAAFYLIKGYDSQNDTFKWKRIPAALAALVLTIVFISCVGTVPTGHRGVVIRWGAASGRVLNQGLYFVAPVSDQVVDISVKVQAYTTGAEAASKDLQDVNTQVTLNYHVMPSGASSLFQEVGVDYQNIIIKPAVQEAVKAATAQYDAEKLITERPTVKALITSHLSERLMQHDIVVDALSITDFKFSPDFAKQVEAKVTAYQNALTEENNLKAIRYKAEQTVASAEAEAKAIEIKAKAIKEQGGAAYAQYLIANAWDGHLPQYMFGNTIPLLNLSGIGGK